MAETPGSKSPVTKPSPIQGNGTMTEVEALRRERDELESKLQQIAQVIGAPNTDRILHDVRNVMNELVLLRSLSDLD